MDTMVGDVDDGEGGGGWREEEGYGSSSARQRTTFETSGKELFH